VTAFDLRRFDPPLEVPTLSVDRVVLRPFALSDLPLVRTASADHAITSITSVPPHYSDEAGRAFVERQHRRASDGDGFSFVIAEVGDPAAGVGSIGLWLREIDSGRASVGYWLVEAVRGRKLAGWALRALVAFAVEQLAIPRLHLFVEPWNVASARTAESAGFSREARLRGWERIDGEQRDVDSFVLLRDPAGADHERA
jgi:[ribosomal protein S5]-alanine N-acetyltransferase